MTRKDESRKGPNQKQELKMEKKGCKAGGDKAETGEVEVGTEEVFNQSSLTLCFRIWQ